MPAFLQDTFTTSNSLDPPGVALRLLLALLLGGVVAGIYRHSRHQGEIPASFPATLILLCILIAMVSQVVGDNVARAFSLVGALSIVRFRTVVRDTQDTAYVILAVVTGMAVGAHNFWSALIGLGIVSLAAGWCKYRARPDAQPVYLLTLHLEPGLEPDILAGATLRDHVLRQELLSLGTVRKGASMEYIYEARLRPHVQPTSLVRTLISLDGIQSVQLRRRDLNSRG